MLLSKNYMNNQDIISLLASMSNATKVRKPVEYRAYYDLSGKVLSYTCDDLPGNYIIITREQYAEAKPDAIVDNGKIMHQNASILNVMVKKAVGRPCSKYDVNIVIEDPQDTVSLWAVKKYNYSI